MANPMLPLHVSEPYDAKKVRQCRLACKMGKVMEYADYTRNTTEPLKRVAHGRRYQQVVDLIARPVEADKVLDYGCGDGHLFLYFIGQLSRKKVVVYHPHPKLLFQVSNGVYGGAQLKTELEV